MQKIQPKQKEDLRISFKQILDSQKFLEDNLRIWQERIFHNRQALQSIMDMTLKKGYGETSAFLTQSFQDNSSSSKRNMRTQEQQKKLNRHNSSHQRSNFQKEGKQEAVLQFHIVEDSDEEQKKEASIKEDQEPKVNEILQMLEDLKEPKEESNSKQKKAIKFEPQNQKSKKKKSQSKLRKKQKESQAVNCDYCGKVMKQRSLRYHRVRIHGIQKLID